MQRKNIFSGLASIVGATVLNLTGCGANVVNHAPTLRFYENDGTIIEPTIAILEEVPSCDDVYLLSLPRGNVTQGQLDLKAVAQDKDKNDVLSTNIYPVNNDAFYVNVVEGTNTSNLQELKIEIDPKTNPSLGTYEIARATTTDGRFRRNACIYMSTVPGTTGEVGGISQIPGGNGENENMTCHSDDDCDMNEMCQDGNCAPHEDNDNGLTALVNFSCGLPRSNKNDLTVYEVTPQVNGEFTYKVIAELNPNTEEGRSVHNLIPTNANGKFYVAVEGNNTDGTYAEVFRAREMKLRSSVGYIPENCPSIDILNWTPLPSEIFTVTSEPGN